MAFFYNQILWSVLFLLFYLVSLQTDFVVVAAVSVSLKFQFRFRKPCNHFFRCCCFRHSISKLQLVTCMRQQQHQQLSCRYVQVEFVAHTDVLFEFLAPHKKRELSTTRKYCIMHQQCTKGSSGCLVGGLRWGGAAASPTATWQQPSGISVISH